MNADPAFAEFLGAVCADPALEAEWIDLLSQLEYVGCRKIVKGVGFEAVSLDVLRHVSEEASHAFLLKSVAEEGGLRGRSWREGLFSPAGWRYFQRLDHGVCALLEDAALHYPAVSWAVEERVLSIYPLYLRTSRNESLRRVLRAILAQEERHGERFAATPFPEGFRESALRLEGVLWREFVGEVAQDLKRGSRFSRNAR
jgi:hypothetical protein